MKKILYYLIFICVFFIGNNFVSAENKTVYVGMIAGLGEKSTDKCELDTKTPSSLVGSAEFDDCAFRATRPGTYTIKITPSKGEVRYVTVKAIEPNTKLDDNYEYGDVKSCHNLAEKITFNGIKVCSISFDDSALYTNTPFGDPIEKRNKCENANHQLIELYFKVGNKGYMGYACGKIKEDDAENYEDRVLYVGSSNKLADYLSNECSIISGNAATFAAQCLLKGISVGEVKVKVFNKKTNETNLYNYKVLAKENIPESISDLDSKYVYGSIKECKVNLAGDGIYYNGIMHEFDGLSFCATGAYGDSKIECNDSSYEPFDLYFKSGDKIIAGSGCRKLKSTEAGDSGNSDNDNNNQSDPNYSYGSCNILSPKFEQTLRDILDLIKIAGPILALALGTLDFVKAITGGDADKELKSAFARFVKRIAAAIVLFLLPIILGFLLDTFLKNTGYDPNNPYCGIVEWDE